PKGKADEDAQGEAEEKNHSAVTKPGRGLAQRLQRRCGNLANRGRGEAGQGWGTLGRGLRTRAVSTGPPLKCLFQGLGLPSHLAHRARISSPQVNGSAPLLVYPSNVKNR